MKKIMFLLIILLLVPSLKYAQFHVLEKVEVYISYGEGVQNKIEKIFLANSEKKLYYSDAVDLKKDICILYDVEPGEYLFGFDLGEELVLAYHVYSIKYDPVSYLIYSEIYYENKVEIRENHNLKIYLYVANEDEDSGMGMVKKKELQNLRYDSLYFDYFIPGNYELDAQKPQVTLKNESSPTNESEIQEDIQKVQMTSGCYSTFKYAKQMTEFYADYSPLFNDPGCSYCYAPGYKAYVLTLNEQDIKYHTACDKLKIKKLTIYFTKLPDKKNQNLDDLQFGKQIANVSAIKQYPPGIVTKECVKQGGTCRCKFEGTFSLTITHQIYIRDELNTQKMLCDKFYIPCIVGNKVVRTKSYPNTLDNARYFYQAMLDHEKLHCVQYRMLAEALFKGQFPSGTLLPFYFGSKSENDILIWKEKEENGQERTLSLADKICESIEDITCCNPATRECDKEICEVEEAKIKARDNAVMTMESIIENLFESYEGQDILELPAWHFFYLKFNEYKWGGQSCDK